MTAYVVNNLALYCKDFADNIEQIARDNRLFGHGDDVNIPMHTM